MKHIFAIFLILFLLPAQSVSAHLAGQPPFFKVNGVYSDLYEVPTTSVVEFRLPQDKSPDLYLVNEAINFEIDTNALPIPPEVLSVSEFIWNFGDDSELGSGLENTHSYKRAGSYFLEISVKTKDISQPQLIQSNIIHIIPQADYKLPVAKILVNGEGTTDPLLDDVKLEFGKDLILDASGTEKGTGTIVEYIWDTGDGKTMNGEKITYQYDKSQYALFPVLRVVDENGLISDAFIQVTNADDEYVSDDVSLPSH